VQELNKGTYLVQLQVLGWHDPEKFRGIFNKEEVVENAAFEEELKVLSKKVEVA